MISRMTLELERWSQRSSHELIDLNQVYDFIEEIPLYVYSYELDQNMWYNDECVVLRSVKGDVVIDCNQKDSETNRLLVNEVTEDECFLIYLVVVNEYIMREVC